jgi:hypothetical protein
MDLFADMPLDTPAVEAELPAAETPVTKEIVDKKQIRRNRTMLENLPVLKRDIIDIEGIALTRYKKIGEEITEVVEFEPGKLYRHQYVRIKYCLIDTTEAAKTGDGVRLPLCLCCPYTRELPAPACLQRYSCKNMNTTCRFIARSDSLSTLASKALLKVQ